MAPAGAKVNNKKEEKAGSLLSLENSLMASAKGWIIPHQATLFGPLRDCLSPKIFRSNSVKNATFSNTGIKIDRI